MRKILFPVLILLFAFGCTDQNSSAAIDKKISAVLHGSDSDMMKLDKIASLDFDLARAYIREKRPDDAIEILQKLIRDNRHRKNFYGEPMGMVSAFYGMEVLYYEALADAYTQKNDKESAEKATKKSKAAAVLETKLGAAEEKQEQAEKAREKAAILN